MTVFLFLKQIVDVLYRYRFLDYLMVFFVLIMLLYQVALVRPDIRKGFTLMDGIVLLLGAVLTWSFAKDIGSYGIYFKVLSALLMYFVGRIYYERIQECYGALVAAGYFIVYLNFLSRFVNFGKDFIRVADAKGDLYYYDTDMAFAMILAMVFIVMFGHNTLFKYFTVFIICPYMVFFSDAGIQMVLMLAVYAIIAVYIMELLLENKKPANMVLAVFLLGLLAVVAVIYLPVFGIADDDTILTMFGSRFLDNDNMYGRYKIWQNVWKEFREQNLLTRLFGIDMGANINMGSLYMKLLYTSGYAGVILAVGFIFNVVYYVVKVNDRKTFYIAVILMVMLLGTGVTVTSMESTQMSWFPMMFIGMVVSSVTKETEEKIDAA